MAEFVNNMRQDIANAVAYTTLLKMIIGFHYLLLWSGSVEYNAVLIVVKM